MTGVFHVSENQTKSKGPLRPPVVDATPEGSERRPRLHFTLGLIIMVLALCSGLATYLILTGLTPIVPTQSVVVGVLLINLVLVLAMLALIAWQVRGWNQYLFYPYTLLINRY